MRKLKLQVQMTIDGFISGINGEMDWLCTHWTEDIISYVTEITESIDTIILGRKLAEGFIPHWENVAKDQNNSEFDAGVKYSTTLKIVFTKTIEKTIWNNTEIANGNLEDEINKLKNQNGKDIIVYGGGAFVTSLIKARLIDEFHLFINPTAIGKGMTIFKGLTETQNMKLKKNSKQFDCGIMMLCYHLA